MSVNEIRNFMFENYYKRIGFTKENSYYSMKHRNKKYLLLLETELIKKCLMLVILKNNITRF